MLQLDREQQKQAGLVLALVVLASQFLATPKLRRALLPARHLLKLAGLGAVVALTVILEANGENADILSRLPSARWRTIVSNCLVCAAVFGVWQRLRRALSAGASLKGAQNWVVDTAFSAAVAVLPPLRSHIHKEMQKTERDLEQSVKGKDWRAKVPPPGLPAQGRSAESILSEMRAAAALEKEKWLTGKVSGAVYHGGDEHSALLDEAYRLFSVSNPLHVDVFSHVAQYEAEVVSMTARLLDGGDPNVVGALSSGGTESIILAVKAHWSLHRERGVAHPEIVACTSAHAALDKACELMGIRLIKISMDPVTFKMPVAAVRRALSVNTILIYSSAPSFPQGIIDPIEELGKIALHWGCGLHVDCCLGGFYLPFARALGQSLPPFDFSVRGVTSMSCDTHKYGYASKGTSVVLYRNRQLRAHQYFCYGDWTGGLYVTPTIAGSRPGGLVAAAWASMMSLGRQGYQANVAAIMSTRIELVTEMQKIPELRILGTPEAMIVCFDSPTCSIYAIGDAMTKKGWNLNSLQKPPCLHLCITLRTVGRVPTFIADVKDCIAQVLAKTLTQQQPTGKNSKKASKHDEGTAAMYGMAGSLPAGPLKQVLGIYADVVLKP